MKTINKLFYAFFLLTAFLVSAQDDAPPNPSGGGLGGSGTGSPPPSSPIDMYVFGLGIVALMFIVFFTKKYAIKKI